MEKARFVVLKTALFSLVYGVCISWIIMCASYAISGAFATYPRLAVFLIIIALLAAAGTVIVLIFNVRYLLAKEKVARLIFAEILGALLVFMLTLDPIGALIKWLQVVF